jgi:hypothetical protein
MDRDRADTHPAGRPHDPPRNLAAIGNKKRLDHRLA